MAAPATVPDLLREILATLDPTQPVQDVLLGQFVVACRSQNVGLSSVVRPITPVHVESPISRAGKLLPSTVGELIQRGIQGSTLEASLGLAALNSVLTPPLNRCQDLNAARLVFDKGRDRAVAVIGHFPFVARLAGVAREHWVFELPGREQAGDRPSSEMPDLLPRADVVAITGTTIANQTLPDVLSHVRPDAFVVMLGPSTPLSPVLFDLGIDALCGAWVADIDTTWREVGQGATFKQLGSVRRLTLLR